MANQGDDEFLAREAASAVLTPFRDRERLTADVTTARAPGK